MEFPYTDLDVHHLGVGQHLLGDAGGDPLEKNMTLVADDPLDGRHWNGVVDRLIEIIGTTGDRSIERNVHIDLERLGTDSFLRESADDADDPQATQFDLIHEVRGYRMRSDSQRGPAFDRHVHRRPGSARWKDGATSGFRGVGWVKEYTTRRTGKDRRTVDHDVVGP